MRIRLKRLAFAALAVLLIITQTACGGNSAAPDDRAQNAQATRREAWLLDTLCSITVYETGREDLLDEAFDKARAYEDLLSRHVEGSDVDRFNRAETSAEVSDDLLAIVGDAMYFYYNSDGLFDISIGPVAELWDFSSGNGTVPDRAAIEAALPYVGGTDRLEIRKNEAGRMELVKPFPEMKLDLGAIAKGYIAERVADFLAAQGVGTGIVNFGGNVCCVGQKTNAKGEAQPWVIGIEKPLTAPSDQAIEDRDLIGTIRVYGGTVATSGTYERAFTQDGVTYHHVLDPRTGYPVETDLVSATVAGPIGADCDALATMCLLLGSEASMNFMNGLTSFGCVLVTADGQILTSAAADFTKAR